MSDVSHGFRAYLPQEERAGVALCLSGGGYRAALFHLGMLRRLNELGVLSKVDTITSVSGGSVMAGKIAAHVVRNPEAWGNPGDEVAGFEDGVAAPMRELTRRNIRTRAVLERLKPWRWRDQNAQVNVLAAELEAQGTRGKLADLPPRPRFVFCATDVTFRAQWVLDSGKRRIGEDPAGYSDAIERWTIARASAASSCFPVAFSPMRERFTPGDLSGGTYDHDDRSRLIPKIDLSDGGLYDNLGLEPVWRDHAVVLVSDAAPAFTPEPDIGRLWSQLRYTVTLLEQATDVRKRWLVASFLTRVLDGAYWGIASDPGNYPFEPEVRPYSRRLIHDVISQVRIDFDVFSDAERAVLETHGYLMAEIAVKAHTADLVARDAPLQLPYGPEWMDEDRVRAELEESHRTKIFSRRGLL
ncbi:MAG: hypothetical protein HW413_646 [Thermoleophilia bacterium]|nr:hypothetical protein [Thermoleophilia bacterium]